MHNANDEAVMPIFIRITAFKSKEERCRFGDSSENNSVCITLRIT